MSDLVTKSSEVQSTGSITFNIKIAVGFGLLWHGLYYILHKYVLKAKSPDYSRRIISVLHWLVSFGLTIALYCGPFNLKEQGDELKFEDVAIMNAFIYVLFDLSWNIYYQTETALMLINHVVLLTTTVVYIFRDTMSMVLIAGYTLITCTEPILHLRFFLKHYYKEYILAEYSFIASFLVIRAGLLTYLGHKFISDENVDNIDKVLFLANYTTGLIFCVNIVGYLQRKFESNEKGHILRGPRAFPHPNIVEEENT